MLKENYLIINRKAMPFAEMRCEGKAVFTDKEGHLLDRGILKTDSSVYAALYCDDVQNVTFVVEEDGTQDVKTILWAEESAYKEGKKALENICKTRFSFQDIRLNRYAEAIAEKLANGVRLRVTDAVVPGSMIECPECGVQCEPGSQYCMDCGAEL